MQSTQFQLICGQLNAAFPPASTDNYKYDQYAHVI